MEIIDVPVRGGAIDLSRFLKLAGLTASGGEAKYFVQAGEVTVNGQTETRRRRKLRAGDVVALPGTEPRRVVAEDDGPAEP